jgi:hypothetical protein
MPFAPQAPPPPALHAAGESAQDALVDSLRAMVAVSPQLVFDRLAEVTSPRERERLRRSAFLAAASAQPEWALKALPAAAAGNWTGDLPFRDACRLAKLAGPGDAAALMNAVVSRQPELAIREWPLYESLPHAREIFQQAAALVPDAAVAVASGNSPLAAAVREKLASHPLERVLGADVPAPVRARLAWFFPFVEGGSMTMDAALAAAETDYAAFRELARRRSGDAGPAVAAMLDRALTRLATEICLAFQQSPASGALLAKWAPREVYLLLAYSAPQDEDQYFAPIFDRYLAARGRGFAGDCSGSDFLLLPAFLEQALGARRLDAFLNFAADDSEAARWIAGLLESGSLDGAFTAADVIENTSGMGRLRALDRLLQQRAAASEDAEVTTALRARLKARLGSREDSPAKRDRGGESLPADRAPSPAPAGKNPSAQLIAGSLYDKDGVSLQRHLFYDDTDGVESFESFRSAYSGSPHWKWQDRGGWVLLTGGRGARQIRIAANEPIDLLSPANSGRQAEAALRRRAVSEYIAASGVPVSVIVHRGHSYHLDHTIDALPRSARIVFLGSCRGMARMREVVERSPRAAVIATRAAGTAKINDALLKALNEALLRNSVIDWPAFWSAQQARFHGNGDFASYVPPHRNAVAEFARELERVSQSGRR